MKQGYYYIVAMVGGITYYYHADGNFRWNIWNTSKRIKLKTWAKKAYAEKKFQYLWLPKGTTLVLLKYFNPELNGSSIVASRKITK